MSFRISAYDYELHEDYSGTGKLSHQIYGNNEFPKKLSDYLVQQGVKLDGDGSFLDYEITNLHELLKVMLQIHNEEVDDDSYWDFKPSAIYKTETVSGLLSYIDYKLDVSIVLIMHNFVKAFDSLIERYWDDDSKSGKYRIKDGMKIYLSGF